MGRPGPKRRLALEDEYFKLLAALAGAVGVAGQGEDFGVVDETIDHRRGYDVV